MLDRLLATLISALQRLRAKLNPQAPDIGGGPGEER